LGVKIGVYKIDVKISPFVPSDFRTNMNKFAQKKYIRYKIYTKLYAFSEKNIDILLVILFEI